MFEISARPSSSLLPLVGAEAAFVTYFAMLIICCPVKATGTRLLGLAMLGALTYGMEKFIVELCLASGRPHWAATTASLLWVQFLNASELVAVSRIDALALPSQDGPLSRATSAIGLLWNMRRVGTQFQVKNVPSTVGQQGQSRTTFVVHRIAVTLVAYLFVDLVVSMPPPDPALVQIKKATLWDLRTLSVDDVIFRMAMTISYWVTTATLNLFMTNLGAILVVILGLCEPADCPPLYGPFSHAVTVRRFWG